MDIIRDAPFGQFLRYVTKNRILQYPEEKPDFHFPEHFKKGFQTGQGISSEAATSSPNLEVNNDRSETASSADLVEKERNADKDVEKDMEKDMERGEPDSSDDNSAHIDPHHTDLKQVATPGGTTLIDWYSPDDQANPQNWSPKKKAFVAFLIDIYTLAVYSSSSIYVSSQVLIEQRFGVGEFKSALGLALFVLGYGIGPLIWSPLSEIPVFGRNIPYVSSFTIFTILALPASLVDNLGGLLVLRFLLGFFGSPCLASGGASMGDMYSLLYLGYPVAMWTTAAFLGPAIGPLLSGYSVYAENWRWSQWEVLWFAAPVCLAFIFFLPETNPATILYYRARRLRKLTGNEKLMSQSEIDQRHLRARDILVNAMIKPMEICIKDPAIMFVNVYTALTYGIYYSFFEVFPLVYGPIYHFNVGETGTAFLCIAVACLIANAYYMSYLAFHIIPDMLKNGMRAQEYRLRPALIAAAGPTVGLFLFGWTARASIHWIVSVIGITIYGATVYVVMQCIFTYVPMSYPQYAASLFASNDFFRSMFAFGSILFSRPMYIKLGIGKGVSLLGGLSVMGIIGMWLLYFFGAKLRARSKFAI